MATVDEPIDPALDAAILAAPTAIEPRRALADLLNKHGHPRGKLIELQLADAAYKDISMHTTAHHDALVGTSLAGTKATWLYGFIDELTLLNNEAMNLDATWPAISRHPTYRFLRKLRIVKHLFVFDPALPPPPALRELELAAWSIPRALAALVHLQLPRVTRFRVDAYPRSSIDVALIIPVIEHSFPALEVLEVVNALSEPSANLLVRCVAKRGLRRLELDRLGEEGARALLDEGSTDLVLITKRESLSVQTREALARAVPRWQPDPLDKESGLALETPALGREWATLPPVTQTLSGVGVAEWIGSGIAVPDHPMHVSPGNAKCATCAGTNTSVIWARVEENLIGYGQLIQNDAEYHVACRTCGGFTRHTGICF